MGLRLLRQLAILGTLAVLLVRPSDLASCGPFFTSASFTRLDVPEDESAFFSGQLGILQPTYWRRYLAMSYRILQGMPLTPAQVASIPPVRMLMVQGKPEPTPADHWEEARLKVPGTQPLKISLDRDSGDFTVARNCGDGAFVTAQKTLDERIRLVGANSREVRDWLAAQDVVFSNCSGGGEIPEPAPRGSSGRILADREYQIAAAYFYAGKYDEAKARFRKIAADTASPWLATAALVAVRADLRAEKYAAAQDELHAILADPKLASVHDQADALLGFADRKVNPDERLAFCGKRLLSRDTRTLARDLVDYTFLYDHIQTVTPADEITTWIEQLRVGQPEDLFKHWQQGHAVPWLVAALLRNNGQSTHAGELIAAARQVPFDSPAWATVRFHAIRLLMELGKQQEARDMLHEISPHLKGESASTINAFRAERMKVAENLREFLDAAPRLSAGSPEDEYADNADDQKKFALLPMFDQDAAAAFGYFMPLRLWLTAMKDLRLPKRLRTELAVSGFVRATILDDPSAVDMARVLGNLKPTYKADMDRYLATPADRRRFAAVLWLARHPEASIQVRGAFPRTLSSDGEIDSFRDNWWCPVKAPPFENEVAFANGLYPDGWKSPSFLTTDEQARAAVELKVLSDNGNGPGTLAKAVIAWNKSHPDDPRLPEALAMAVKASRYSCSDEAAEGPVSDAFRILHNRFPNSQWAKDTPYWFK